MTDSGGERGRRSVLGAAALTGAAAALPATAARADTPRARPTPEAPRVTPGDPRYGHLAGRGANRFRGTPDEIRPVESTEQVVRCVQRAVRDGRRIAVRSGGHCFEDFVDHPGVRVVVDTSRMRSVEYDPGTHAFAVEPGATLEEVYRLLHLGWGVTVPGGYCPDVGIGGHVPGGAYGPLCRLHGLLSDHLYAVETVVVDRAGRARAVVAGREPGDPARDLWWAHTGGGGGTFGIATRYWFRSPGTTAATPPERLLPVPPATALTFSARWHWSALDEAAFVRLADNYGRWAERNAAPGSPAAALYAELSLEHRNAGGGPFLFGQVTADGPAAERLLSGLVTAVSEGTARPASITSRRIPWLTAALRGSGENAIGDLRIKVKSGYLRRRFTDRQLAAVHHHLTRKDTAVYGSVALCTYGGRINTIAPDATAAAQRDSVLKLLYLAAWSDPADDAAHLDWIRALYRDVYADTGGVPAPGGDSDGAFINYADADLADPALNTSGIDWQTLYFKGNAAALRRVKARWDPLGVFRHALSVPGR
ncbi:FAD-binding oxidoreductase [Streptomyces qinzhouensis]|uniref:FAD-binding oxidoreductase n=1 Tax=Streptomyces qinzhouensis TaxID=2599401 RepID=A0A5B8IMU2_9ACTN|nr:FAD-binding oxidoreductase [Streptomyces qinzhouensis]QDY79922.1 FAD-binding oxidoreductase [Streptomyces qinzhouensis]